ncbi:arsenate reductase [Dissoconium aciculare CBS 342.82]|uniref:Arsenate reductase n=1 Tax=Dissoconium aciculare CBS 342.82 TaxID=1314786 RepID=A0A6J3M3Q9_9PEZI|nr:arsenate reductase [Dissoconium aciculare CBS 342.82]KAF1822650.1 arsenate reductase [Dissoconium aciculare CBS 342.82]
MAAQATSSADSAEQPWYAAYPQAQSKPHSIARSQVLELLKQGTEGHKAVLVDLRRTDFEGGTIQGSINLPAQSIYPTIPSLYTIFRAAGVQRVIWYCGSSRGRGNRAAAWFADYLEERSDKTMQSLVLEGGIKGWVGEKGEYLQYVQGYDESKW